MDTAIAVVSILIVCSMIGGCVLWHARQIRKALTTEDGRPLAVVVEDVMREVRRATSVPVRPAP